MNNKILIICVSVIVAVVILLGAGYFLGVSFEKQKTAPQIEELQKTSATIKSLSSSKIVTGFVAQGNVKNISGRIITLVSGSDTLMVTIADGAQVYSMTPPSLVNGKFTSMSTQSVSDFKNIKVGDILDVNMKMTSDGAFQGMSAVILNPPA